MSLSATERGRTLASRLRHAVTGATDGLGACDREPIHIPGSIQPHGMMLVVDPETLRVCHVAGDVEGRLGVTSWLDAPLDAMIGPAFAAVAALSADGLGRDLLGELVTSNGEHLDVSAFLSGDHLVVELEPAASVPKPAATVWGSLETAGRSFQRAATLTKMCEQAATAFRQLTGFDRVMVYRFLGDGAGEVLGEDRRADLSSFLHHHFPASDIPQQARALYVRNLTRVIPDVAYIPSPLRPRRDDLKPLDLSDSDLRSVSPIHLQYLANMGVAASASISIVHEGVLWGLIACHNATPLGISYDARAACRTLAGDLARQIKARDDAERYRERIRLTQFEPRVVDLLSREGSLDDGLQGHMEEIRSLFGGDGAAVALGGTVVTFGPCPSHGAILDMAKWLALSPDKAVFETDRLAEVYKEGAPFRALASGVLAIRLASEEPCTVFWFRAEQLEVVKWAGNPHKPGTDQDQILTPRASFAAWSETVRGRSRPWSVPEVEAAGRLRTHMLEVRRHKQTEALNRRLIEAMGEQERLLKQNDYLIGEANHRVQNSLQLVSSFLSLQARSSCEPALKEALEQAQHRITAVSLVHRRLYRHEQIENVDAAEYIGELCGDMATAMGPLWGDYFVLDLSPVTIAATKAVTLGLVLTELLINAQKYAYGGAPGPLEIQLVQDQSHFTLIVGDRGVGSGTFEKGFGSRMMDAMVAQLRGQLTTTSNQPGVRVTLSAPI